MFEKLVSSGNLGQKLFPPMRKLQAECSVPQLRMTIELKFKRRNMLKSNLSRHDAPSEKNKVMKGDNSYVTDKKD